mgnify:CR=1 FL=1
MSLWKPYQAIKEIYLKSVQIANLSQKKEWLDLVNSLTDLNQQKITFTKQSIEYKVFL